MPDNANKPSIDDFVLDEPDPVVSFSNDQRAMSRSLLDDFVVENEAPMDLGNSTDNGAPAKVGVLPLDPDDRSAFEEYVRAVQDALLKNNAVDLIEKLLGENNYTEARSKVITIAQQLLSDHFAPHLKYSQQIVTQVIEAVADYICGYGPVQWLLDDPDVTEIIVRSTEPVMVERRGMLETTDLRFVSDEQLVTIMRRIARQVSREVSESEPLLNAWLRDGSRTNMVLPPICPKGPVLTIRKFSDHFFHIDDLIERGSLTEEAAEFLMECVKAKTNIIVSGGTGTGKTAFLRALAFTIPEHEYLITIEDIWELRLEKERQRVTALVRREAGSSGRGEISLRDLLVNALRMRPDRILVGEVRGAEALEMLQAASTGHDGLLSTVHANSPELALKQRLPTACAYSGDVSYDIAQMQTNFAVELIAQVSRDPGGYRHVSEIACVEVDEINPLSARVVPVYRWDTANRTLRRVGDPVGMVAKRLEERRLLDSSAR